MADQVSREYSLTPGQGKLSLERGVHLWEVPPDDRGFATLSLEVAAGEDPIPLLNRLFAAVLRLGFEGVVRWHTHSFRFTGNALQRRRFWDVAWPSGLREHYFEPVVEGEVPTIASRVVLPLTAELVDALTDPNTLVVLSRDASTELSR